MYAMYFKHYSHVSKLFQDACNSVYGIEYYSDKFLFEAHSMCEDYFYTVMSLRVSCT